MSDRCAAGPAPRSARVSRVLVTSFGATLLFVAVVVVALALSGKDADAATYTLTTTVPTTNWSDTTKWTGGPVGTYPGQSSGDTAVLGLNGFAVNVDVNVLNPVTVNISGTSMSVTIPAGGALHVATGSSSTSSSTISLNGGTFGVASTDSVTSYGGPITINSGTFDMSGSLAIASGNTLTIAGATTQGSGTITIGSGANMNISCANNLAAMLATTVNNSGTINYTCGSPNFFALDSGAVINNSGTLSLQTDQNFSGDTLSSINNSGTISKSGGTSTTFVPLVNNNGILNPGSAKIILTANGTHTGQFILSSATSIVRFGGGTHDINAGASVGASPAGSFELASGTLNVNTAFTAPAVTQSGGTLAGTNTLIVTNGYAWSGGDQNGTSGGSTQFGASTFKILPSSAIKLIGRVVTGNGTVQYTPVGGTFTLQSGAQINLTGGSFDLQGDTTIASDASGTSINVSGGTLTKTAGTKTIVNAALNITGTGTVQPQGTTISFGNGGSIGGTSVTVDTSTGGSLVDFSGGTTTLNGGTTFTSANLSLSGGTLTLNTSPTVANFSQSGTGILNGTGTLSTGTLNWTGGTMSGTGTTSVINTAFINGGVATVLDGWTLTNNGTAHYQPSVSLGVNNGANVNNSNLWVLENSTGITSNVSGSPKFTNSGTLSKSVGGTTVLGAPILNSGTIALSGSSILQLSGGGQFNGGSVNTVSANDKLEITTNTVTFATAPTFSGPGLLRVHTSGTLTNSVATTVPNFELDATGTLGGAGTFQITSGLKWTGGTMTAAGTTLLASSAIGNMTALTANPVLSSGRIFQNDGTLTYNPAFSLSFVGGTATFFNNSAGAIFDIQGNGSDSVIGTGHLFTNNGTVKKTTGGGTFTFSVPFTNAGSGIVNCQDPASTIAFTNGGSQMSGGTIEATNATATIDFPAGGFTVSGGAFAGNGAIRVNGGTLTVNTTQTLPAAFEVSAGQLGGSGALTIPSAATMKWSGGTITGNAGSAIEVLSGGSFTADTTTSSLVYNARPFIVDAGGNFAWNAGANSIVFQSGSNVSNNGTFTVGTNGTIGNATAGTFSNAGLFKHTASGTLNLTLPLSNATGGTVSEQGAGIIALLSATGVTHTGTFDAQSGGFIDFGAGTHNMSAGAAFSAGTGTYKVAGGTVNLATNMSAPNFRLFSGALSGGSDLTTTSTFLWDGGQMSGAGTTNVSSGTATLQTGPLTLNRNFTLSGNTTFSLGANSLTVSGGVTITNGATFDIQSGNLLCTCTPTPSSFANSGTLQKSATATTPNVGVPISGSGALDVVFGGLNLQANANFNTAALSANGSVNLNGPTITIGSVSGAGTVAMVSGATNVSGAVTLTGTGGIATSGGTLTLDGTTSVPQMNQSGGTVTGSGNVSISANSSWSGGTLAGTGSYTIPGGVTLAVSNASNPSTLSRTITNNGGTITYTPAVNVLTLSNGTIDNSGTLDLQSDVGIAAVGTAAINNIAGGTLVRSAGTTTEVIDPPVSNAGTILLQAANTKFSGGLTQTAGSTTLGPGNLAGTIAINGGILNGSGTITGSAMTITGDYTQTSTGVMNVELNGTTAGTQYDQVDVSGNVTLDGTLNATLGYSPAAGDFYDVLKIGAVRSGDFATKNLPTFPSGGFVTASYTGSAPEVLRLQAIVIQSDVSIAQIAPTSVTHTQNATVTFTVTNNGPDPATGVAATLNFSGATFVSAAPGCSGTGPVNCTVGSLGVGASAAITLVLNANSLGTITTSGSVTSTTFDQTTSNNSTPTANITVNPAADLSVAVTDSPDPVNATANVTYTIAVTNNGPDSSTTPTVSATLTNGTISSAPGCATTATTATCSVSTLASGGSAAVSIVATAPSQGGTMSLAATVSSSTADLTPANDSASQSTTVTPKADLSIVKTAGTAVAGQTANFTITVTNNGPSDATSVTVSDPAPAGTTFSSNSGACTTAFPCALGTLIPGQSVTINSAFALPSNATGTVTNTASVASATNDPNTSNNTSAATATVTQSADLSIAKSGPSSALPNSTIAYDVTVTNLGPSDATGVTVSDPTPARLTFVSASGACASYPCAISTIAAGATKSIHATYTVTPGPVTTITNTATVSAPTSDPSTANNTASKQTATGCHTTPTGLLPADGVTNVPTTGTLHWNDVGAASYKVYLGQPGSGCNALYATVSNANILPYSGLAPGMTYEWRVEAVTPGCNTLSSGCLTFTTAANCPNPPALTAPANGSTVSSPVTFTWTAAAGATSYTVFASVNGAATTQLGTTATTSLTANVANGSVVWYVVADAGNLCPPSQSQTSAFTVCATAPPPLPSVVGTAASGQVFRLEWDAVDGASRYEADEATNPDFTNATTKSTTETHVSFQHAVSQATAFYFRLRSFSACDQKLSANSDTVRVVILPLAPTTTPSINVPAGSTQIVVQKVHFDGFPDGTFPFTASVDKPWLTVTPSSGFLPPSGIDFEITADPTTLPNGTATGTLFVTIGTASSGSRVAPNATSSAVPISINLVTPVSPGSKASASANSLIIPSVGHLDGVNSQWRSDIRVTNTASFSGKVQLIFTPSDSSQSVKSTTITVGTGDTVALDDIVRNWYGVGALGDAASGALEIRPLDQTRDTVSITTVASSRTYNATANGTLGQFIPAIPFSQFIAKSGAALGLQQIAQNADYRTNFGLVEAAGKTASLLVTGFGSNGTKLFDFPLDLKANEQRQLNAFLSSQNLSTLNDGRLQVQVTGGDGRVTAYASLIDNRSGDPLLISGIPLAAAAATRYVLPGVADISNGLANWRSDVRILNAGAAPQSATLTFVPLNSGGEPKTAAITINPGETKQLDALLASVFGLANVGGALHVTTPVASTLVVSGRTYNQLSDGSTYGQFIPAVTEAEAVGKGGTLHVLQVEESVRYRTNFGIAEVSGKEATVEVSVVVPDSKIAPKATLTLQPFEYRQTDILAALGLQNIYNARIAVKVIDGDGRVTAYGSVIDMKTQDPTYVQAQK
jgi:large repetitive protein